MSARRPDRYDYCFHVLGVVLFYGFFFAAKLLGWSMLLSIAVAVVVFLPIGLALGWLKWRLQTRLRNGS